MKIIGITDSAYIVEMTPTEVARLTGDSRLGQGDYYTRPPYPGMTGAKFDLHQTLTSVKRVYDSADELKRTAESLRGLASVIERAAPVIVPDAEVQP